MLLNKSKTDAKIQKDWENFLACSNLPSVNSDSELNTFLAIFGEEAVGSMNEVVNNLQLCQTIVKAVEDNAMSQSGIVPAQHQFLIGKYRDACFSKLDSLITTSSIIQNAEIFEDNKASENQEQSASADVRFGIWVRSTPSGQQGLRFKQE